MHEKKTHAKIVILGQGCRASFDMRDLNLRCLSGHGHKTSTAREG